MKTLRYIGATLLAIILCVSIAACSSDDEEDTTIPTAISLVGTDWKGVNGGNCNVKVHIGNSTTCMITVYYPNSTKVYNQQECTYTYDEKTGRFTVKYSDSSEYKDYEMMGYTKGNALTVSDKYSTYTLRR